MSSSRVSLHDCSVSIRVPTPPSAPPDTPEQIALQALSGTRDQTEAYIGETIFVLLTLSHKEASASCDALQRAIANCDEPYVYMGSLPHTGSDEKASCRLPVMRHTRWLRATHHGCAVMCKGMWLLVRSPPQTAQPSRALPMAGRHKLVLCMREMSVPNMRNSSVWATIDRASRLFGKSVALYATRPILLSMPIDIRCECVTVSHSVEHALVNVSVRNSTGDAYLSVAPPYINVSSSRVVARHADVNSHGRSVALHARYEFVLLSGDDDSDDDSGVSSATAEHDAALSKQASSHCSCDDDDALFVPSLNHATTRHAATLAPREVYNFVFRALPNSSQPPWRADAATLRTHECIQTSVAVAWSCAPQQQHASAPLFAAQRACEQLHARGGGGGGGGGETLRSRRERRCRARDVWSVGTATGTGSGCCCAWCRPN
eukprot:TRINITY_DN11_c0_g1_i12.p1 TRINITY_DN11_c0_g1~~TRINITY_DN11_c0_g1_i12.p1  ORF type:complete len:433 (-),score=113.82 TRINITY_DN11_c0_g1_i12:329-1627(-)